MTDLWSNQSTSHKVATRSLHVAVFLALGASALASQRADDSPIHSQLGGLIPLGLLLIAALISHKYLSTAVVLGALSAVVQLAWVPSFVPAGDVFYAYIFHALGSSSTRKWRRFGLASAVVAVLAPMLILYPQLWPLGDDPVNETILRAIFLALACASIALGGWAVGFMRWQSRAAVEANVAAQLAKVERARLQREADDASLRERIATEMHDVVAHSWAVVAAQADGARYSLSSSPDQVEKALDTIAETARTAISDLRRILHELRYQQPDGAVTSSEQTDALIERVRNAGVPVDAEITGAYPESPNIALTVHRILGEALTNALKHGDTTRPICVYVNWDTPAHLRVSNAVLTRPASDDFSDGTGHGVFGMRQRAAVVGASITVGPDGDNWIVQLDLPASNDSAARTNHVKEPS